LLSGPCFLAGEGLFSGEERASLRFGMPLSLNLTGITVIPASNTTGSTVHTGYTGRHVHGRLPTREAYTGVYTPGYTYPGSILGYIHQGTHPPREAYQAIYTRVHTPGRYT